MKIKSGTCRFYNLYFEDKEGNVLKTEIIGDLNLKSAKEYAKKVFAESLINDLHKIRVTCR